MLLLREVPTKKNGWLDVQRSINDVFIKWGAEMDLRENVIIQNCGWALVKPKKQPGWVVLAP